MNPERLRELLAEHVECKCGEIGDTHCTHSVAEPWPCEQSQILKLALEAEGLKQDGGSLAQRELKDHYEREFHRAQREADRRLRFWTECFDELAKINRGNAAEAERLRTALEEIRAECGNKPREWTKEIATVALGRD